MFHPFEVSPDRCKLLLLASVFLFAAGATCRPRVPTQVEPPGGAPGTAAVVRAPGLAAELKAEEIAVEVGGRPATVLRVELPDGIEFLVPERDAGATEVTVKVAGREVGRARFNVLPAPARQLVLEMSEGRVALISTRGAAGLDRPSRELPVGHALAYDVVTPEGRLVATGVVPHPLSGRNEVFEPEGTMHGVAPPKTATFTLRIPAVPKGSVVRFYEVEPGVDLSTAEGRAKRRLVSEVKVGG